MSRDLDTRLRKIEQRLTALEGRQINGKPRSSQTRPSPRLPRDDEDYIYAADWTEMFEAVKASDDLSPRVQTFIDETDERLEKFGDRARLTDAQFSWLERLYHDLEKS